MKWNRLKRYIVYSQVDDFEDRILQEPTGSRGKNDVILKEKLEIAGRWKQYSHLEIFWCFPVTSGLFCFFSAENSWKSPEKSENFQTGILLPWNPQNWSFPWCILRLEFIGYFDMSLLESSFNLSKKQHSLLTIFFINNIPSLYLSTYSNFSLILSLRKLKRIGVHAANLKNRTWLHGILDLICFFFLWNLLILMLRTSSNSYCFDWNIKIHINLPIQYVLFLW